MADPSPPAAAEAVSTPAVPPKPRRANGRRKWWVLGLIGLVAVATAGVMASRRMVKPAGASVPSVPVQQAEFVISITLKGGELEAVKAENIVAPPIRGELKIVQLFPEGEQADVGALLVQFDQTEFQKRLTDAQQELEASKADLEKTQATQKAEIARLESAIKDQDANLKLALLQVDRMAFEATIEKERAQIEARKAELSHTQAVEKLEAQRIVNGAEVKKRGLEISRRERELEKAQRELASTTIHAAKAGLVVYGKVWKGDRPEKVRVGDNVWGGVNVISLPDLTRMQVKTAVNEVDVDKLKAGQPVLIKLDALPEPTFHGKVTSIASLGREKEGEKNVKVFDVVVEIEEQDPRLKPGMTASSEVVVETVPPRAPAKSDSIGQQAGAEVAAAAPALPVFIPLDAVFEKDGKTIVYRIKNGKPEPLEVKLGKKNDNHVIIEEGLAPDDRVALRDPTLVSDEIAGTGKTDEGGAPTPKAP
jgi:HlyD family secretion protein